MTAEEIQQIKDRVLRELPKVLEEDPGFVIFIEGILSEKFPRRDEFARLLDEVEASRKENREQFGQVHQQFAKVDQQFAEVDQQFDDLKKEIQGLKDWMELNVGGFQRRAGRRLEDVVAGAFCYGLVRNDIRPEQVRLRQKITDSEGVVFRPGKTREVDLIALGPELLVFEVKATADADDIDDLGDKVTLVRHLNPGRKVEGVLVMLGAERDHRELCAQKGLVLIP